MWPTPSEETTQLFLVRHGATDANEQKPYILQGRGINFSLSETGRRQAAAVADCLSQIDPAAVYCSEMIRARETATEIASRHGLEATPLENLHEVHVGDWEGKSWDTIMQENETEYTKFMNNPGETPYLNGESYRDVLNRSRPVIDELLEKHVGQRIIIVAHNVVNRAYLADLMGLELRLAKGIHQGNCCINVIHHRKGQSELISLNSHFHVWS